MNKIENAEIEKALPFLKLEHVEFKDRGTKDSPAYGEDELYALWEVFNVETEIDDITLLVIKENDKTYIKFYYDTVAYNGITCNDECTEQVPLIDITNFKEVDWQKVLTDIINCH